MILAELACRVAFILQKPGNGHDLLTHAGRRTGYADLREAGPHDALAGDEGRSSGCARLLTVRVGEQHPFVGQAIDVRRLVAHQAVRVAAEVGDADIVAPDDEDVRALAAPARSASGGVRFLVLFILLVALARACHGRSSAKAQVDQGADGRGVTDGSNTVFQSFLMLTTRK